MKKYQNAQNVAGNLKHSLANHGIGLDAHVETGINHEKKDRLKRRSINARKVTDANINTVHFMIKFRVCQMFIRINTKGREFIRQKLAESGIRNPDLVQVLSHARDCENFYERTGETVLRIGMKFWKLKKDFFCRIKKDDGRDWDFEGAI